MRTRPEEITDTAIVAELVDGWGDDVDDATYLDVGFGSHHWRAVGPDGRWFVTVDDLDARRSSGDEPRSEVFARLEAALRTARALRDHGLAFVIAPEPDRDGAVLRAVDDRFTIARYPDVPGTAPSWGGYASVADRLAVLDLVIDVHAAPLAVGAVARADDFVIPERDELERALGELGSSWDAGPYSARTQEALRDRAGAIERGLERYDRLADDARRRPERTVLTHGEPHTGNTVHTDDGWVLVDWDTTLLAPPERDLWMLADDDGRVVDAYAATTGRDVLASALDQYRLGWDLTEVALFVADFRRPHGATEDTAVAWLGLERSLAQLSGASEPSA